LSSSAASHAAVSEGKTKGRIIMTEHELKCWPEHYAAIDSGAKTCELRLNDRPYQRGDALLLKEWEPIENAYTGRQMRVRVTHVLSGGPWLSPGYVAMSICLMGEDGRARVQEDFRLIADAQRAQLDDAHNALTAAGVALEPHEPHEGCATQLGHRVRALVAERDEAQALAERRRSLPVLSAIARAALEGAAG
jgi:hypothetical protein